MKAVWIALGVVALGGVGFGLWWALKPETQTVAGGGGYQTPRTAQGNTEGLRGAYSKLAAADTPHKGDPVGDQDEVGGYIRTIGQTVDDIQRMLDR